MKNDRNLTFEDFSQSIIESGDIDPDYLFISRFKEKCGSKETIEIFKNKLLIYNLESELLYYTGQVKVEDLKFGAERQKQKNHFPKWKDSLNQIDFEKMMSIYDGSKYEDFFDMFSKIDGMGPWASWKAADIMNKVFGVRFIFNDWTFLKSYEFPLRGLLMVSGREEDVSIYKKRKDLYLEDFTRVRSRLKGIKTHHFFSTDDVFTIETCLCKYHSYKHGKYHVGEDLKKVQRINQNEKLKNYWGLI